MTAYSEMVRFVQQVAPTWRKPQQEMLAQVMSALVERPSLCETEIARGLPDGAHSQAPQSLHGRLKRLERFLANPRLDEVAIFQRWSLLSCHFGETVMMGEHALLPVLLDTTYFASFAALVASVPCGGRGLPIALTTYHREQLVACFPVRERWPRDAHAPCIPVSKGQKPSPASAQASTWLSQNLIEEELLDYLWSFLPVAGVIVADRGFARASLFRFLQRRQRHFAIRFKADTWITVPDGRSGPAADLLALRPGHRRWVAHCAYGKEEQVPVSVLGVWEKGQREPWYIATDLPDPHSTETLYRWRMRIESGNRDEKSGVLLREGGDRHRLTSALHLHRLLLADGCLHWFTALVGLQALHDLANASPPSPDPSPHGPADPPPVVPHRGKTAKPPPWLRRFVARGPLSYVRLGMEVLRAPDLRPILIHLVRWLAHYLSPWAPLWRPWQLRYRHLHWWPPPI